MKEGNREKRLKKVIILLAALLHFSFTAEKIKVLYKSLNPTSISSHLAFYQLFPETLEGKKALDDAWKLLSGNSSSSIPLSFIPQNAIDSMVALITKAEGVETLSLKKEDLIAIEKLGHHLPNRKLKGHFATSEEEVLLLPSHEIDLSRGLLLAQIKESPQLQDKLEAYEALIDLMALQILTQVSMNAPPNQKIRAINRFIFQEMGYRFPPHSVYAKDIDLYTYLPSVIDSRKGVCLGVSILYLSLSQRLNLPLEAVTPPGHIYVRYQGNDLQRNIETTARGVHVDTDDYLGIENESNPVRNVKEVIGLSYFNEASVHWQNENYRKALKCYEKALLYLPDDILVQEFMGFNYLFVGEIEKGHQLLSKVYISTTKDQMSQASVIEDYLQGKVDEEGIRTLFLHVDEKRDSLLVKQKKLEEVVQKWPFFRGGYHSLGVVFLQLHRYGEALEAFNQYAALEKDDPSTEFILAELNAIRSNYPAAWRHLQRTKELLNAREKLPKAIREFQRELALRSPE